MRLPVALVLVPLSLFAARNPLPGQAGNDDIELVASVIIDREEIKQAVGADLGPGYVVVRMQVTPKTEKPLRISPDDFTIICRKDGQRSVALSPGQIAGTGELVVKAKPSESWGPGTVLNGPIWGGVTPRNSSGKSQPSDSGDAKPQQDSQKKDEKDKAANPLMDALKAKILPDKESLEPVEGLLYFPVDGKFKPKDLAIIYKGPAGRLTMEFANPK